MIMGKKARKEAARKERAIRRMRLQTFIALLIPVMIGWRIGINGGGYEGKFYYNKIEVSPKEKKYISMQIGLINKTREILVHECLGIQSFYTGQSFYETANDKLKHISELIVEALPDSQTHYDQMVVLTYIIYAAFHDYAELEDDRRNPLKQLVSALKALANHLIPAGSPLCGPLNDVYWKTRNDLQQTTDWTLGGTLNWQPSEDEIAMGIA